MLSFIKNFFSKNESFVSKEPQIIPAALHTLSRDRLSHLCLIVLDTLNAAGFETYLVGGSVRDLLLGREPKDFDVATNAKPEEIRRLFKNCRLIGRRFRLAHIYFKKDIIEVATFRKEGKEGPHQSKNREGILKRDNVYGTLEDDVWRRDFTLNALYYDVKHNHIIDYTQGLDDLKQGIIRIIGKADARYREDPVRILRAIRFAAKLGMTLENHTAKAIAKGRHLLSSIAPSRLVDESHKLFSQGNAVNTFALLRHHEVLQYLYPLTEKALAHPTLHLATDKFILSALKNTDARIANNKPINPAFLVSVFLWYPLQIQLEKEPPSKEYPDIQLERVAQMVLSKAKKHLAFTQLVTETVLDIWLLQFNLIERKKQQIETLVSHPRFRAAYDFLCLRALIEDNLQSAADWWTRWQAENEETRHTLIAATASTPKYKSRRRRRRSSRKPSEIKMEAE